MAPQPRPTPRSLSAWLDADETRRAKVITPRLAAWTQRPTMDDRIQDFIAKYDTIVYWGVTAIVVIGLSACESVVELIIR